MSFYKPPHYILIHVLIGFIAVWYSWIGVLAVAYQLGQLIFNVRVFPIEGKILAGNSIKHTACKLGEIAIGYLLGWAAK